MLTDYIAAPIIIIFFLGYLVTAILDDIYFLIPAAFHLLVGLFYFFFVLSP